jgi:hypothetical protein
MEWFDQIWSQVAEYINIPYLLIFILLSYLMKRYVEEILQSITKFNWQTVYTVLIIATVLAVPFFLFTDATWVDILFSYAVGTSLHELIFKWIEVLFASKNGNKQYN